MKHLLAILCLCCIAESVGAAELGRLFYTPMQRAQMDRKRVLNIADTPADKATTPNTTTTLNGRITRSDGKTTTWVNGIPDYDPRFSGERNARAKVGQTIDSGSGEVQDPLRGGSIVIKPAR